ncbi:MAG TPA: carbohydrate binding domain-containing protein [Candidatus Omnitrophota bacterium]|nr:carbohydrate binding domain-containing protein [Candidatus Omnitrophota bacterium]
MKRPLAILLVLLASIPAFCQGSVPSKTKEAALNRLVIDNFEAGDFKKGRDWWTFDRASAGFVGGYRSKYAIEIKGTASNWYVGGIGTYLGHTDRDMSRYDLFDADICNNGQPGPSLKIELYQDNGGKGMVVEDTHKKLNPKYTECFSYKLKIDWTGWKHISVPLQDFTNDNPEDRDTVWNPKPGNGAGGLLQMQVIATASSRNGPVDLALDNIEFREGDHGRK